MICKGIIATTQVDAHNACITLAALERAAEDITNGECALIVSVNHDPTIIPIGKIINAHVEKIDGDEHGLFCEQDIFSTFFREVDGTKYILLKSSVDDRPLTSNFSESSKKLLVQTDPVNFKSNKDAAAFLKELSDEYDIETSYFRRNSAVPDPELMFQLLDTTVSSLFIYLAGKPVIEKVGNHIVDHVLAELDSLYTFLKTAIFTSAKQFIPANRPVTYVFIGKHEFLIELVVQTTNPNTAIRAISEEKLLGVVNEIENLKKHFSSFLKIQLVYNTETEQWEFNYIATERGEIIGTEKSYKKTMRKIKIALPENKDAIPTTATNTHD